VAGYLPTFARLTTRRTDLLARVHSNRVAHPPGCAIGVGPGVVPLAGGHYFTVLATSPVERTKQRSYRGTADPRRAAPCWDGSMSATTAISRRCRERLASRRSRIAVRYAARVAPGSRHSQLSSWVSSIHDVFHSVTDEVRFTEHLFGHLAQTPVHRVQAGRQAPPTPICCLWCCPVTPSTLTSSSPHLRCIIARPTPQLLRPVRVRTGRRNVLVRSRQLERSAAEGPDNCGVGDYPHGRPSPMFLTSAASRWLLILDYL
jgi:hypothetical protein